MSSAELAISEIVLKEHFGPVAAAVGSILGASGPLNIGGILQRSSVAAAKPFPAKKSCTPLTLRQVKESLFVLLHHNLLRYRVENEIDEDARGAPIAEVRATYRLEVAEVVLRFAFPLLIAKCCKQESRDEAIMLELQKQGRLPTNYFTSDYEDVEAVKRLLLGGFVEEVSDQQSRFTTLMDTNIKNLNIDPASSTFSSNSGQHSKAMEQLKYNPDTTNSTRLLHNGASDLIYLRINTRALLLRHWKQCLVDYTINLLNETAGLLMGLILDIDGCQANLPDAEQSTFTIHTLGVRVRKYASDKGVDIVFGVEEKYLSEATKTGGTGQQGRFAESKSKSPLEDYVLLIVEDVPFIKTVSSSKSSSADYGEESRRAPTVYRVDWESAQETLRMGITQALASRTVGDSWGRLTRCIHDQEMVDEKDLSRNVLMAGRDIREKIYNLMVMGIVHAQEVPRTADRAASKNSYLWTIQKPQVYHTLAMRTLRGVVNCVKRLNGERNLRIGEILLAKSERSDVIADPSLLSPAEQRRLAAFRSVSERLDHVQMEGMQEYLLLRYPIYTI